MGIENVKEMAHAIMRATALCSSHSPFILIFMALRRITFREADIAGLNIDSVPFIYMWWRNANFEHSSSGI
jgi:hypothetical protein